MSKQNFLKVAAAAAPKTHEEANESIAMIGIHLRALERIKTAMNDELAAVKAKHEKDAAEHKAAIALREKALEIYCTEHRAELLKGKSKTYSFAAGEIAWRALPPKVTVKNTLRAISWYAQNRMRRFLRLIEELDKEAMLKDAAAAARNPHIKIGSEGEEFYVRPFEAELAAESPSGEAA